MTTTSRDFWLIRLTDVLDKAVAAPSERSRAAYLELARHYCSMHVVADNRNARPAGAPRNDPPLAIAAKVGRHDFGSVHDALMEAA